MKPIMLNDILHLNDEEINNCKVELNMWPGSERDRPYLDIWLEEYDDKQRESGMTRCSYWSSYGDVNNFKKGQKVFSFIRLSKNDEWLLISAASIIEVIKKDFAKVEILEEYKQFFGRVIMKFKKGHTRGRWVFNYSYLNNKEEIIEILPTLYRGEQFEGYDKVNLPFKKLKDILNRKYMPSYYENLQNRMGVYCLTDTNNGKLYIGSATGKNGFAQRWSDYVETLHGGNVLLNDLYKENGSLYFEKYFTYTILEDYALSYDIERIKAREQYWKRCLNTIEHGYNDN